MRWAKTSLRNSFFGWMANQAAVEPSARLEEIRKAMLHMLEQSPDGNNTAIERRVLFAQDLDELWYLRPDLMTAVAAVRGETAARACLTEVTSMFDAGAGGKLRGKSTGSGPGKSTGSGPGRSTGRSTGSGPGKR
jgi:hypothetical protein